MLRGEKPSMTKVVEAIYSHGVLEPLEALELEEKQRVRVTIETIDGQSTGDRQGALQRLMERLRRSSFSHGGPYPTREQLHERDDHV